ncbi:hypothetical protein NLI96_g12485 [Meripilus lineatus]|uniref:Reverse transcriptase domain-containing protein n=1 Tax=Meripilus lineatus TaxID=2056292 RepID=A0AAD5Y854_9APHY|nr:hypothetical protein NLI96_g12485 [Physisporinus lineatus]
MVATVPIARPSPYSKRWWTKELTDLQTKYKKASSRAGKRYSTREEREAMIKARNAYQGAVRSQQRKHWREWLQDATEKTVWLASKYATREPEAATASRMPDLKTTEGDTAHTMEEKSKVLLDTFFPTPPTPDLSDTHDYQYPPAFDTPPITTTEILAAVNNLASYKAPGPNLIPNIAIQMTIPHIITLFTELTNACLRLGYHPQHWKTFSTITLRKPHKPDYTIPKAYRPIALEDTLGKVMESIMARRLSALAEQYNLLPPNHFGGRPGRTTTDAVLYLTQRIKDAWRTRGVASVLFLDISQAFPSVSHERLIHNLRKRQVPNTIINWVQSFLKDRKTRLHFDDFVSELLTASTGVPQGSPISPILYIFYSADLLEITDPKEKDRFTSGYIDDTALAVISPSIEENIKKLEEMTRNALRWSQTHACKFDIGKFQLVHFTRNERKYSPMPLNIADHTVSPGTTAKYLGVILDRKLRWKEHAEDAISKGTKTMLAINRLSKTNFGLPHHLTRQLYTAVVLPKIEYGLPVWFEPIRKVDEGKRRKGSVGIAKRIGKVQRIATRIITGGLRTTATDVLDYHAALPPIHLRLNQTVFNAAVRLATLPPHHPLHKYVKRCASYYPKYHHSPIHEMMNAFPQLRELEIIDPTPVVLKVKPHERT